ncbi:MAG: bacteriohemerythrin [bacterium]|jgi:hemerythrin|nr:bacteriohemerythrin [bacterium]
MANIEWKTEYETGVPLIDEQHRHLVEIINKFEDALQRGKGSRQMNEIIKDLIGYTQEHFATEERLMAEAGYEHLKLHQSQHRQLMQKVERFQFEFNGAGKRITAEMHEFLAYWLVTHILRDDKAYSPVLTGQAVPEAAD